jgi:type IV secretion system protein VirB10
MDEEQLNEEQMRDTDPPADFATDAGDMSAEAYKEDEYAPPPTADGIAALEQNASGKTNKRLIIGIICGVMVFLVILSIFVPLFKPKQKENATEIPSAQNVQNTDYESIAKPKEESFVAVEETAIFDSEEIPDIPLALDAVTTESPPEVPSSQISPVSTNTGGGYYASTRPNTRDDRLQSKSISGIKGLTPTQKQYADGSTISIAQVPEQNNPYAQFSLPTKDQYMQQMLALSGQTQQNTRTVAPTYGGQAGAGYGMQNNYITQNDQSGKMQFYQNGRENAGQGQWLPQASIWQGTIFEATLLSDINTDLPGEAVAVISKNVYSSLDGKYMLIPQNSRLFGTYNSSISYSQSRIQVGWHTLIRPDGYAINLGNMQATDARGAAGLPGIINDHPFQYLKALGLISAFRILGTELTNSTAAYQDNQYVQNLAADTQNIVNQFGSKIIDRALDVQPTIVIRAGTKINIAVNSTLLLPPLEPYPVNEPYHR